MRSKKHSFLLGAIAITMIFSKDFQGAFFFASLSGIFYYKWWNHPQRKLLEELNNDSKKFNVNLPSSYPLHQEFLKLYSKYLRLSLQYPALKNTYRELVDSMWLKLSQESNIKKMKEIIRQTDKQWPSPIDVKNLLNKSLAKVSVETKLMNEAMAKSR